MDLLSSPLVSEILEDIRATCGTGEDVGPNGLDSFIDGPRPIRVLIKRALKGHLIYLPHFWPGVIATLLRL